MKNKEIKETLKKAKIFQWQVAESLGIGETALSRMMRHELPEEDKKQIIEAIEELKKEAV
ncbi:hypothetical protein Q5O24_12405 [Eubacteriaceae bacterium ES3]|nr:hypothetical protein Q5O24_12405 [Eubacteriaceae bacterium ES3]